MFPHAPLLRLQGPILQAQLLETPLLNLINFPTLVATKAARIAQAADGGAVMEFGLRRAQGIDGGLAASRAAYVGGCASTSNVLAGRVFGIPVKGTHAHSWVMSYEDERDAFAGFAEVMPDDCVLLVDTYDSEVGVRRAVEVGRQLQRQGHRLAGIRLDSGDLKALAQMARRTLDEAGLTEAAVVASGDLDEHRIAALRAEGAPIDLWGVGTRLATASDDPALGGIYKLSAYREPGGDWRPRLKVSDSASKSTLPGVLQVRRFRQQGAFVKDVIYDIHDGAPKDAEAVDLEDGSPLELPGAPREPVEGADLLVPVLREGAPVYEPPALPQVQRAAQAELGRLPEAVRRLSEPAAYPVGITPALHRRRQRLTRDALATSDGEPEER
jgi:nicotinate phosphoribosyltransferase